jgi:SecD/SecF fusion protein
VSIYQLSFTFVANKVKNDAKAFAAGNSDKEASIWIPLENVFNLGFTNFNFDEVSDKQINRVLT